MTGLPSPAADGGPASLAPEEALYHRTIGQLANAVEAIAGWLDKAERNAAARGFEVGTLLGGRLAPDMGNFVYQVQSACDYLKGGAAWLSGQTPPVHRDDERTVAEVRERIGKTVAFARSVDRSQFAGAGGRRIKVSWSPAGTVAAGEDYLFEVVLPNVYFHVSMAYAVLRHNGVDVGKMDYLGPIHWIAE